MPEVVTNTRTLLKKYFGYDHFRPLQEDIINTILEKEDALVLMPTGGGKSLCYQIPALMNAPAVSIVVSPLISLMEDQVSALSLLGVSAFAYHAALTPDKARTCLKKLHQGELTLLYISPERLMTTAFLQRLQDCHIALFAIDEAHCISQWGHDFRPEYHMLSVLKETFPQVPIIALTATADSETRQNIIEKLHLKPRIFIDSFNRPNIYYHVIMKEKPVSQVIKFLKENPHKAGIIYCHTRENTNKLTLKLQHAGFKARAYHAGLSKEERDTVQTLFRQDDIEIVVATIAFGMGINKPNVSFVIHYDLPKTLENYYQETGRAGRDGAPALALLLYAPEDAARLRSLLQQNSENEKKLREIHRLNRMTAYAEASTCRRRILLNYFDETNDKDCGYCDICDNPPKTVEVTREAKQFLSAIYRQQQSYGLLHTIDVLLGAKTKKIETVGHHRLSTYGIGKAHSSLFWRRLAWHLIHEGYCRQDNERYHVLKLEKKAIDIFHDKTPIFMAIPKEEKQTQKTHLQEPSCPLFQALKQCRRDIADEEDKPPFMIFSDMTLKEMAAKKPKTLQALLNIIGVGQYKLSRYGEAFLNIILSHKEITLKQTEAIDEISYNID